jgi:hypothetical protein
VSAGDDDYFRLSLTGDVTVGFTISMAAGFSGSLNLSYGGPLQVSQNSITSAARDYVPGDKVFYVHGDPGIAGSAAYSLDIYRSEVWDHQPRWGSVLPPQMVGDKYRLTASVLDLPDPLHPPTEIRFWVSGFGFVGKIPFQGVAFFDWVPPAPYVGGTYGYRAQLFAGDVPVALDSDAAYFTLPGKNGWACGQDTDQLTLTQSGFRMNNATKHILQSVSVTPNNTLQPMAPPYALVLKNLRQYVTLVNAAGLYSCNGEPPSPFVLLDPGGSTWPAGKTVTVLLEFDDPPFWEIFYTPQVVSRVAFQ